MGVDFFNDSQNKLNYTNLVTVGEGQRQSMLSNLLRSIGSLQSQSLNVASDTANRADLPLATRLAQQRGIALGGAQAAQQGAAGIDQFISQQNIQGMKFLLDMAFKQRMLNKQDDFDINSIFGAIGAAGGAALGGGL